MDKYSFSIQKKKQITPNDNMKYIIHKSAIRDTEKILLEYADINPSNEGLVYWGGRKNGDIFNISMVIAPKTESNYGRVSTSNRSNFDVVRKLNENDLVQIAQVHSHPGKWVDHSSGDDEFAPFKTEGLISIVVPEYCKRGVMQLGDCGVHRYTNGDFIRLHKEYIENHFNILNNAEYKFVDFRK